MREVRHILPRDEWVATERMVADVVVAGAGAAGLAAGVAAAESGASVIVVEKRRTVGGNSLWAEGIFAADSPAQRRNGVEARKDDVFKMAMTYSHWSLNAKVVRAFIDKSADTVRWLEAKGVVFDSVVPFSSKQMLRLFHNPPGGGPAIIWAMMEECRQRGVRILYDTDVERIILDDAGSLVGVMVSTHGTKFRIAASSLVVATGGFAGNDELLRKYCDFYTEDRYLPGYRHMGEGLALLTAIGAATEGLGRVQKSGPNFPGGFPSLIRLALEPSNIWLNQRGERFTDETTTFDDFESVNAILREPEKRCYVVLDHRMVKQFTDHGFDRVYLGSLRPTTTDAVHGLEEDLRLAAAGFRPVARIDPEACNGCGKCADCCPETAIALDTSCPEAQRRSPCTSACPAGVNVRGYVHLLRNGLVDEACDRLYESLPLAGVTGRVCPHVCETECARNDVDEPVNINELERFVADRAQDRKAKPPSVRYENKIAVIGSGPAGLSCAYFLARSGYRVTVFEAQDSLGGMLRAGIPAYRLPRAVLDAELDRIRDTGVEFKTGVAVGKDMTLASLQREYDAVFFAGGAQVSKRIALDGASLEGVEWGVEFLCKANTASGLTLDGRVVVIGGGNVAVDVALTALRLGANSVTMASLELLGEMPAFAEGVRQALAEGVTILDGWGPRRLIGKAFRVAAVELVGCTSVTDDQGGFCPSYDEERRRTVDADLVILAIGQTLDTSLVPDAGLLTGDGALRVDTLTLETARPGVFAGGDALGGSSCSVVAAIADGRRAAESIERYLKGEDLRAGRDIHRAERIEEPPRERMAAIPRVEAPHRPLDTGPGDFTEVKVGFDEVMAKMESERCMTCGSRPVVTPSLCKMCGGCEISCPAGAVSNTPVQSSAQPLVMISESLDEIARWMGADAGVLRASIRDYNASCDAGHDSLFAKDPAYLHALRDPPYYVLRCNIVFLTTMGGAKVNERMEVLSEAGGAIPGVFAAGNDTGGWECDTYNAFLPGSTYGFAINSGRIAGESAARYSASEPSESSRHEELEAQTI
jgi:NADPH-dependent glutamate synthase beta subunit-like oxidoreductase